MIISKTAKIENAMSKDANRSNLHIASLQEVNGSPALIATSGHVLAIIPVDADIDEFGPITKEALIHGRKLAKGSKPIEFKASNGFKFQDGSTLPRPSNDDVGEFPNWQQVIPKEKPKLTITLNPKFLFELAQAIDSPEAVTLEIIDALSAIKVKSRGVNENLGVIMPIRV